MMNFENGKTENDALTVGESYLQRETNVDAQPI